MCGINGILRLSPQAPPLDLEELRASRDHMASRGPDGSGEWLSPDGRLALAHRRLAILDLTDAGAQPMASLDGRFRIVYNGEIYNFRELRSELEATGVRFRSRSDTEILLALYAREGKAMLRRLRGMFAFAVWDAFEESLLLARDSFGIKPLYYTTEHGGFRFASQVRALLAGGKLRHAFDPAGLCGFLLWGSVPEPYTIREGVRALPAGTFLEVRHGVITDPAPFEVEALPGDAPSVAEAIEGSIRAHLVADVPLGVFLSAGLDSAMVAAVAARHSPEPPITLTVRFETFHDTAEDEGPLAAQIASHLGTRHREHTLGASDLQELWADTLCAMDQPSIDGFNTFAISRAAREAGLTVVLSGLGGDELFGGYPSFHQVPRSAALGRMGARLPGAAAAWAQLSHCLFPRRPKLAGSLRHGATLAGAYFLRRGLFLPQELPGLLGRDGAEAAWAAYDPIAPLQTLLAGSNGRGTEPGSPWVAVHRMEMGQYLRNQLLRDSDWASMAHSVELRVPFVDAPLHRAIGAAGFEPGRSRGKAAVARLVAPDLPPKLLRRRKTGFYIPLTTAFPVARGRARPASKGQASRAIARRMLGEMGMELRG